MNLKSFILFFLISIMTVIIFNLALIAEGKSESYLLLPYNFPWSVYYLDPPWYSAMAQGEALPLLIYAYQLTGLEKYKDTADGILNSFFVDVSKGGITYKTNNSGWWYELYAGTNSKQPKVLNGMLLTLVALDEYYRATNDSKAKFLFDQGTKSLEQNLPLFDATNGFSYYDIHKRQNKLEYHIIHINLLNQLYNITNIDTLKFYSDKWAAYNKSDVIHQAPANIQLDLSYVPFVDYGNSSVGMQRNPVTVDHVAKGYYEKFLLYKDDFSKHAFLNNIDWLVKNTIKNETNISFNPQEVGPRTDKNS